MVMIFDFFAFYDEDKCEISTFHNKFATSLKLRANTMAFS